LHLEPNFFFERPRLRLQQIVKRCKQLDRFAELRFVIQRFGASQYLRDVLLGNVRMRFYKLLRRSKNTTNNKASPRPILVGTSPRNLILPSWKIRFQNDARILA
jgi:hypothetical protein